VGAFCVLLPASLLTESRRKLTAYVHTTWTILSDGHPNGFIFLRKTCISLSELLLQIFYEKGQDGDHRIHHPTVLFCIARAITTDSNQDLGYDGIR